jgi:hypothetical protein
VTDASTQKARDPFTDAVVASLLDPVWARKNILRVDCDPWQDEILEAFADLYRKDVGLKTVVNHEGLNRFSIRSGHGPGKTFMLALLMHYAALTRRVQMPCTAPKEKQLRTRLWPRFRQILAAAHPAYQQIVDVQDTKITWCGDPDWMATPETAAEPENLQGYHPNGPHDWLLFMVDEASGVADTMFRVVEGALSSAHSAMFLIGNPTQNTGEFYESHNKPGVTRFYYRRHVQPSESRHVSQKYIDDLIARFGRESPVTKVRGFGEFAELGADQLIALGWIAAAREREFKTDGSLFHRVVSVDVADGGEDFSTVTLGEHYQTLTHMIKQQQYSFPAAESPIETGMAAERTWLATGCSAANGDYFVVDSIGVGAGTAGYLLKKGYPVVTYKGGESSDDAELWRNRRTQSYIVARDAFRDGTILFEDDFVDGETDWSEVEAQLCSVRRKPGSERLEDIITKEDMRRLGIKSPDRGDGIIMQFATQAPTLGSSSLAFGSVDMESASHGHVN